MTIPDCSANGSTTQDESGLRFCRAGQLLEWAYATGRSRIQRSALKLALKWEGGELYSGTLRRLLLNHHGVRVGAYSYGQCLRPGGIPAGVEIGRYCSLADGVQFFLRNHPYERLSMHPFFYNKWLGYVERDTIETGTLSVGHDTWIGHNAIVTPGCRRIGVGAVVAAGAVVTRDVPDFAIVAGNPARVKRKRFDDELCEAVLRSRWWEKTAQQLMEHGEQMTRTLPATRSNHPILCQVQQPACVCNSR